MKTNFWDDPDLLVLSGSHLYGYSTPESDEDLLGFVVPPMEIEVGMVNRFEQKTPSREELAAGDDRKVYSLRKFLNQLTRNDTQCLEILFAPESHIKTCTDAGRTLIANRDLFISKHLFKRFAGYAYSEFRKVRGVAIVPETQTPDEQKIIDQIRNAFRPTKKQMDEILEILYEGRPKKEVSVYRKLGEARKKSIDKYGYSVKNAAHCIRLLMEGVEILNSGTISFPLHPDRLDILRNIRAGNKTFKEVEEHFLAWEEALKQAAEISTLPKSVDMNAVNDLFLNLTLGEK